MKKNRIKKTMIGCVLICLIFNMVGCGSGEKQGITDATNKKTQTETDKKNTETKTEKKDSVTVELVKNTPVTDASFFTYEEAGNGISISSYTGNDKIVVIPEQIEGKAVISIGKSAFANNETLKGIKLSDSITILGDSAFCACYGLEVVICGANLEIIEPYVFSYCKELRNVELNKGLEIMKESCFAETDALLELEIPSSVVTLEYPFLEHKTNVTIITEAGSAAEQYAKEMDIPCKIK